MGTSLTPRAKALLGTLVGLPALIGLGALAGAIGVVALAALAAAVLAAAGVLLYLTRLEPTVTFELRRRGDGAAAQAWMLTQLNDLRVLQRYGVRGQSATSLTLERSYCPWPAVMCVVLLFPIGLLFLLVKRHRTMTVSASASASDAGTVVHVVAPAELRWLADEFRVRNATPRRQRSVA